MYKKIKRAVKRQRKSKVPRSLFKKALSQLRACKTDKQRQELIKSSSDNFIKDLAVVLHKCLPIYKPLLNGVSFNKVKSFTKPNISSRKRRKFIQVGGGKFLHMLSDLSQSVEHILSSPVASAVLTSLLL